MTDPIAGDALSLDGRQAVGVDHDLRGGSAELLEAGEIADIRLRGQPEHQLVIVGAHGAVRVETRDRRDLADPHSLDSPAKHPAKHHNAAIRRREMLVLAVAIAPWLTSAS